MSERRPGADRPAVDEEDTLIRPGRDFYGSDGAPTTVDGASASGDRTSSGPSTNARAQRSATNGGSGAVAPASPSALSRDREEQPASPVQPRATAQSQASKPPTASPGSNTSGGGLRQKGKGKRRPSGSAQQKPDQTVRSPANQGSAVQGRPMDAQLPSARTLNTPASNAQKSNASAPQSGAGQSGTAASSPSGNPPTLAERIMKRLPPPPEKMRAQQVRADEAKATAQGRAPEAGQSLDDDAPTRPQPRVSDQPSADSANRGERTGAAAAAGAAAGAVGGAAVSSRTGSPETTTQPRGGADVTTPNRSSTPNRASGASASSAAGSGTSPVASTRERLTSDAGRSPRRTRRARLRLARVDPWSVMKTFFLFSIAGGIMACVAVGVVWTVVESSGLFDQVDQVVKDVVSQPGDDTPFSVAAYLNWQRVMAFTALLACIDVIIFTALATLGAFLYNLSATMLGGFEVTLAED
ncbi:MAG: DUF3566 domain-containing protein [Propionibacteriales bacterium]|nr:DUF3566 domain-containing protein [Propionibacteriales bacterium]